jgi:hypothetical protein
MRRLLLALAALAAATCISVVPASAQGVQLGKSGACNGESLTATGPAYQTVDAFGATCISGSISATTVGGFTASALGTPFTASEAGQVGTLPAGDIVVVSNGGAVGVYCNLGPTPSQTGVFISGGGGWFAFTKGAATQVACETKPGTGNVVINMVGGTGLPTGTGGGGGGAGAATLAAGSVVGGAYLTGALVDVGALADAAWTSGSGSVIAILKNVATAIATTNTNLGAPGATACTTDTASCSLNQQMQRLAQRLTTIEADITSSNTKLDTLNTTAGNPATLASQYPFGAVPITATATGTTAATTATLAASASIKTYICGFSIRANANAAATANSTVTGTVTATMNFTQWTAPSTSGIGITEMIFTPCVPSSAINTGIAVISAAPGTGGVVSVSAWGYQL